MYLVDSHLHLDKAVDTPLPDIMKAHAITALTCAFTDPPPADMGEFAAYLWAQERACAALRARGVRVFRMVGIHPRSIPPTLCEAGSDDVTSAPQVSVDQILHPDFAGDAAEVLEESLEVQWATGI